MASKRRARKSTELTGSKKRTKKQRRAKILFVLEQEYESLKRSIRIGNEEYQAALGAERQLAEAVAFMSSRLKDLEHAIYLLKEELK